LMVDRFQGCRVDEDQVGSDPPVACQDAKT
jgi:hypothetical protein